LGTTAVGYTPVKGYVQTPTGTEAWLQNAVATIGPVTIGYDVVTSFYYYSSGVYYDPDCSSSSVNYQGGHAVVVVGYGTDPTLGDYWIMRNSWGTGWGQAGHFLMARNRGNICGLATKATYPTI
jgi:C1A family cysteine protease